MVKELKILHLLGSPSDKFSFYISVLYCGAFPDDMDNGKYSFTYAIARPDGSWSFVEKLSSIVEVEDLDNNNKEIERIDLVAALQRIKSEIKPDLALVHFVCYQGATAYRALIDALDIPVIGGSAESRYLSMDKIKTRSVLLSNKNVSLAEAIVYNKGDSLRLGDIKYPCVVKASKGEDTKAVRLVKDQEALHAAIDHALSYSNQVLIERFIPGREIRCAVVESVKAGEVKALSCMEYNVRQDDIRTTEEKLQLDEKGLPISRSLASKPWFLDPLKEAELIKRIQQQSYRAFHELNFQDFGLFDFRVDSEGNPFFLESNLFCSFGSKSVVNVIVKDSGITDDSLFDMMVENALLRRKKK